MMLPPIAHDNACISNTPGFIVRRIDTHKKHTTNLYLINDIITSITQVRIIFRNLRIALRVSFAITSKFRSWLIPLTSLVC